MPRVTKSRLQKSERESTSGTVRGNWWDADEERVHENVWPLVRILRTEQAHRDYFNRVFYSMFTGRGVNSLDGDRYAVRAYGTGDLQVNIARAIATAANSRIAKDKIRILYLTEGGDWSQQSRAKRITKVVNGAFSSSGFYSENAGAQRDSCVFDLGAVYFYREGTKIKAQRVPGNEIRVDYLDGRYGRPSSMHREVSIPRSVVLSMYPDKAKSIKSASLSSTSVVSSSHSRWISDCIDLVYSWHLPSGPESEDGLFAVSISNDTLESSEYEHPYFPFVFHRWEESPYGFYGQSICHILTGTQYSINKVVNDIQDHVDLSTGFVAIESGSHVSKNSIVNIPWPILEYTVTPPQHVMPPALSREKLDWLQWLITRGHEDTGLSQLFVTSRKPDGLDSGKALREYHDQNSERFQMAQQRYERTFVQAAQIVTGLYEEIYDEDGDFKITTWGDKEIKSINWEAARMDEDDYVVRPVPTSFLPTTPAAKLQTVQEMLQAGFIGRDEAMLLLDYPDLERFNTLQSAPILNIEWRISQMLDPDDPKYLPPEPNMNLELAMKMVNSAYNDAQQNGAPEENLELLRRFEAQTQYLIEASRPPPPQPPPEGPTPPSSGGGPMPEEMLPEMAQ